MPRPNGSASLSDQGRAQSEAICFFIGLFAALLGGLWFLQGIGAVQLRPILCFVDCEPLQGPSTAWAAVGLVLLLVGGGTLWWSWKRRSS